MQKSKGYAPCVLKGRGYAPHALKGRGYAPHALKGQKLLAQGNTLGINSISTCALKGQKL